MTAYYKVVRADLQSYHGGAGKWTVGKWRTVKGPLEACRNGLHFVTLAQLPEWLGPTICPFEPAEGTEIVDGGNKWACRKGRIGGPLATWNARTQRLFAADCAEHVLPIFEKRYPADTRPREAIAVARRFANGEATREELGAEFLAANAAAAANAAYDTAAYAAKYAANAANAADAAANAAANERKWQSQRLATYLEIEVSQ